MSFEKTWYIIPYHIRKLPGITLAYLDVYETIFEFWNNGKDCMLKNQTIMERTGIKSESTVKDALVFFEEKEVLKRVQKGRLRYLVQINKVINEEATEGPPVDNSDEGADASAGRGRQSGPQGADRAAHNNNNINTNKFKKSSYNSNVQKKTEPYNNLPSTDNPYMARKHENEKKHGWSEVKSTIKEYGPGHPTWEYNRAYDKKYSNGDSLCI